MRSFYLAVLLAAPAAATDLFVAPGQSIQQAIDVATDFDRVFVQPGVYSEALDMRGKRISLIATSGAQLTTIDAIGTAQPAIRCHSGEGGLTLIQGFTITGGTTIPGIPGAGVSCADFLAGGFGSPQIWDCIIESNVSAGDGGGIGGDPALERCVIRDNTALAGNGGGAWTGGTFSHCVFAGNTARNGGGAYVTLGDAPFDFCVFVENLATGAGRGGGLYLDAGIDTELNSCVVADNAADGSGGDSLGGALYVDPTAHVTFNECTLVDNVAVPTAGSLAVDGIAGPLTLNNSILRGAGITHVPADLVAADFSNVEGGAAGTSNFDLDPLFHDPATRDYHLQPGSPCVDTGNPARTDPDGSRLDVGAFYERNLYTRWNTDAADYQDPGWDKLSNATGGKQELVIRAGAALAGQLYFVAGSVSGTSPGFPLAGFVVPLNLDGYTTFTINNPNSAFLPSSLGTLDSTGSARSAFVLPPGTSAATVGLVVSHAAVVFRFSPSLVITSVTGAESARIIP